MGAILKGQNILIFEDFCLRVEENIGQSPHLLAKTPKGTKEKSAHQK